MTDPAQLRPSASGIDLEARQAELPCPALNRFFYTTIGADWSWTDRLRWTDAQWMLYLDRPELQTWVAYRDGTPVGYCELEAQQGPDVELVFFGLLPQFAGRGWGGRWLTLALERAWRMAPERVWVHTCSLDHPAALANYESRGLRLFKEDVAYV